MTKHQPLNVVKNILKRVRVTLLPIHTVLCWMVLRCFPRKEKKVLLHCGSSLVEKYLRDFRQLFSAEEPIRFFVFVDHSQQRFSKDEAKALPLRLNAKSVGKLRAYLMPWDLVICSDHGGTRGYNANAIPLLFIGHGSWNKIVQNQSVLYSVGPFGYNADGRWRYRKMLCNSEHIQKKAEAQNPDTQNTIAVVGDLDLDCLLERKAARNEIREGLGIEKDEKVVMLLGSWGEDSLFRQYGDFLLDEAKRLDSSAYRFIVNIHPNEYVHADHEGRLWGAYLEKFCQEHPRFIMRDRKKDYQDYLVASDLIIADHTCVAEAALLLDIPILAAPLDSARISRDSITYLYRKIAPQLTKDSGLQQQINQLELSYPRDEMREISSMMLSYPGNSAARIRQEVYQMLDLEERSSEAVDPLINQNRVSNGSHQ